MKKLTLFLLLLALLLPGCAGGTQEQTLPQSSGEKEPFTDTSFLFQEQAWQEERRVCIVEIFDAGPDASIYLTVRTPKEQDPDWIKRLAGAKTKWLAILPSKQLCLYTSQEPGEIPTELSISAGWSTYKKDRFTVYLVAQDSVHYANDSRVFEIAQKNKSRLQSDLTTLPDGKGQEYVALDEEVVCLYRDGVLQGFVIKHEGRLVAIEYADSKAARETLESEVPKFIARAAYFCKLLKQDSWKTDREDIWNILAQLTLEAVPAQAPAPSTTKPVESSSGVPTSTEG